MRSTAGPRIPEAYKRSIANNDMIDNRKPEEVSGLHQSHRSFEIIHTWLGIARRMVMSAHDRSRIRHHCGLENFARMDERPIETTASHFVPADHVILRRKTEHPKHA
jgi:hypothetical protein